MSESVLRKVLRSYYYVAIWIFLSFAVIVYNKYILDPKMYNWPFPISLTMVHMSFCSSLVVGLVLVLGVVEPPSSPAMTPQLYTSSVLPIVHGIALQLAAVAFEATSLVLIQILLTSKGISLNPITSFYYVAPYCLGFLLVPWVFIELPRLHAIGTF